jgi:hypothetical protein
LRRCAGSAFSLLRAFWLVRKCEGEVREEAYRLIPYLSVALLEPSAHDRQVFGERIGKTTIRNASSQPSSCKRTLATSAIAASALTTGRTN